MSMSLPGTHVCSTAAELSQHPCEGFNNTPCGKPSVHKIITVTDSFGDEFGFFCDDCHKKQAEWDRDNPSTGTCDYCKTQNVRLYNHRDIDEGMHGPVYEICRGCKDKYMARLREEVELDREDDFIEDDSYEEYEPEPESKGHSVLANYDNKLWSVNYEPKSKTATLHLYDAQTQYPLHMYDDAADAAVVMHLLETADDIIYYAITDGDVKIPKHHIRFHLQEIYV